MALDPKDLRVETTRSGDLHSVCITHIPTGTSVRSKGGPAVGKHLMAALEKILTGDDNEVILLDRKDDGEKPSEDLFLVVVNNESSSSPPDACDISQLGACMREGAHVPLATEGQGESSATVLSVSDLLKTALSLGERHFADMMLCRRCGLLYWEPVPVGPAKEDE